MDAALTDPVPMDAVTTKPMTTNPVTTSPVTTNPATPATTDPEAATPKAASLVLRSTFPTAIPASGFVRATRELLTPHGFHAANTLPLIATCRDELAFNLTARLQDTWGAAFNMAGLAGMIVLGRTGILAAASHAPVEEGIRRFVLVALPHIGIDAQGIVGNVDRPGVPGVSHTCGALMALHDELRGDDAPTGDYPFLDLLDPEQGMLRDRIPPWLPDGPVPDLTGLTRIVRDVITADTHNVVKILRERQEVPCEVAVFTGVHINGPGGTEYVEPGSCYLDTGHDEHELVLSFD
jgi:hypothetical protein